MNGIPVTRNSTIGLLSEQVVMLRQYEGDGELRCGGTTLKPDMILTAGHCCQEMEDYLKSGIDTIKDFSILAKSLNLEDLYKQRQEIQVSNYAIHEHFAQSTYFDEAAQNDICLVKLDKDIELVQAINVSDVIDPYAGTECIILGWGQTLVNPKIVRYHQAC